MGYQVQVVPPTICNKYSSALTVTNLQLITIVVNDTFNVILTAGHPLRGFFDGRIAPNIDFTASPTLFTNLFNHLVQFFGAALGCGDPTFPAYAGRTDLHAVHANMPIGDFEFNLFNSVILGVLTRRGVQAPDVAAVGSVLLSTKPLICTDFGCRTSICDRYSDALNVTNVQLLTLLVTATFQGLTASTLLPYFNGTVPGTHNFIVDATRRGNLVAGLVAFFGGALGCSDNGFPTYTGGDMNTTHRPFPVGPGEFDLFNTILLGVLRTNGVAPGDVAAVSGVLESQRTAVCNQCGRTDPQPSFILNVVPKVLHPWTDGFPSGFKIDGVEGGNVTLQVGNTYGFQNMGGCAHPLFISTSDQGAGASPLTSGVVFPNAINLEPAVDKHSSSLQMPACRTPSCTTNARTI